MIDTSQNSRPKHSSLMQKYTALLAARLQMVTAHPLSTARLPCQGLTRTSQQFVKKGWPGDSWGWRNLSTEQTHQYLSHRTGLCDDPSMCHLTATSKWETYGRMIVYARFCKPATATVVCFVAYHVFPMPCAVLVLPCSIPTTIISTPTKDKRSVYPQ